MTKPTIFDKFLVAATLLGLYSFAVAAVQVAA